MKTTPQKTAKTISDSPKAKVADLINELKAARKRVEMLLSEARCVPDFPLEFRVTDAPNSVWQPVYSNQEWDLDGEEYRVEPSYLASLNVVATNEVS